MELEAHYGFTATTSALCINMLMGGVDLNGANDPPVGVGNMGEIVKGVARAGFGTLFSKADGYAWVKETIKRLMVLCALTSVSR